MRSIRTLAAGGLAVAFGLTLACGSNAAEAEAPAKIAATAGRAPAAIERPLPGGGAEWKRFDFLLYGGKFNDAVFRQILLSQETDYRESYVWVAALNYELGPLVGPVTIETEAQVARHTGIQDNYEANLLVVARRQWVWANRFSFSLAIGDGFSLASKVPVLETEDNPRANVFLQYLMVEFDFGLPSVSGWPRFMMRVHHRSGVYGLHCAGTCGSNFVTYGAKWAF